MILKALALGFSTGIFCLGYCYPLLAPLMLSREEPSFRKTALSLALFLSGRLAAYLLFGTLVGLLGRLVTDISLFRTLILPLLFLLLGVLLVLYGVFKNLPTWRLCLIAGACFEKRELLFLFGFLAGLNLCPPFLLALSFAVSLAQIWKSLLFFLFFFLATSVFLLPFLLSSLLSRFNTVRRAARIVAVISGAWFVYLALSCWLTGAG